MRHDVLALALAVLPFSCGGAPRPSASSSMLNKPLSLALPSDTGTLVAIPLPGAKATVLDFFGPTCVGCKTAVPALQAKKEALAAKGAKVVLVGVLGDGESTADAQKALASWGVTAPFLVDREGASRREVAVQKLPATVVVDASGTVVWVAPGDATAEDILAAVR